MRLRSPRELAFRASQQIAGIIDYLKPAPQFDGSLHEIPQLHECPRGEPDLMLAEGLLRHEFPIFRAIISTGPHIDWRRDYRHGLDTPVRWFRRIPYLDFQASGDHKYIWEVNRHQHLAVLAQVWRNKGDPRYIAEIEDQLTTWNDQNPFLRSVNWASALELGFRAISWIWVIHFAGDALSMGTRKLLGTTLYQHAVAISHNLSTYFAPNTHLLGEGVALHAIGIALGNERWRIQGDAIVNRELQAQVRPDGFHFEQSTYYHLYALDMFLFHYVLSGRPAQFEPVLKRMADAVSALLNCAGKLPLIGDDDGGAWGPSGALETCAKLFPNWRLSPATEDLCQHFASCGLSVFRRGNVHMTFDCGPFARGGAGHSHADTLAVTLNVNGQDALVDPGTYTYIADAAERDWFRGTAAHSTVRLGGRDQADPVNPFRWENKPAVRRIASGDWAATGECTYRQWTHRRKVYFEAPKAICIEDEVSGPAGNDTIEQIWHSAFPFVRLSEHHFSTGLVRITVDPRLRVHLRDAWRSRVFGSRERSYILIGVESTPLDRPLLTKLTIV